MNDPAERLTAAPRFDFMPLLACGLVLERLNALIRAEPERRTGRGTSHAYALVAAAEDGSRLR